MRWIVFDTETTDLTLPSAADLKSQPKIIELALVEVINDPMADEAEIGGCEIISKTHTWLIDPEQPLTAEITKITGLTDADLKGKPTFPQLLPEIVRVFLGAEGLVAHNLPFDLAMLINELRRCGKEFAFPYPPRQMCSVQAYHHVKGRNMRLTELYQHVMNKELAQTHRALDDARALAELLIKDGALE